MTTILPPTEKPAPTEIRTPVGLSAWFRGSPRITEETLIPVRQHWMCPTENCAGEMVANGFVWSTYPEGVHHTCDACGLVRAISGQSFPRVSYRALPAENGASPSTEGSELLPPDEP